MKKLLIALMSVATVAFCAKATTDGFISGTSFEDLTVGNLLNISADDAGGSGQLFWSYEGWDGTGTVPDVGVITNSVDLGADFATMDKPEVAGATDTKALKVDAEKKLFRNINSDKTAEEIGDGLYFDTMVQFTGTDTAPEVSAGDKLIVWMKAIDTDTEANPVVEGQTNIVVTAAKLGANNVPARFDYEISAEAFDIKPDSWHRLTIKAINELSKGESYVAGFVVFIDGKVVTTTESRIAEGATGTVFDDLNSTAAAWADKNALFPSMRIWSENDSQTLTSVAFEGTGALDDITFTTTAPSFAADGKTFTVICDENVTSVKYTIGEGEEQTLALVKGKGTIELGMEASYTVKIEATYADGYSAGTWKLNDAVTALTTFTVDASATLEIASFCPVCKIGDTTYGSLDDALSAVPLDGTETTVMLLTSVTIPYVSIEDGQVVVLDLHGRTITGTDAEDGAAIDNYGSLTIIDTVGGGVIKHTDADGYSVWAEVGTTTIIEAGIYDSEVCIENAGIKGGSFKSDDNSAFYGEEMLAQGRIAEYAEGYWTVTEGSVTKYAISWTVTGGAADKDPGNFAKGAKITFKAQANYGLSAVTVNGAAVTITEGATSYEFTVGEEAAALVVTFVEQETPVETVEITITPNENAEYAITTNDIPVEAVENVVTLEKDAEYVITVTAKTDYEYASATTPWVLSDGKLVQTLTAAAAATIVIPAPTAQSQGGWDIPGSTGGINGIEGEGGVKTVQFSSIELTADGIKVGLTAGKIDADGETFGLICKDNLTDETTFTVNVTMTAEKDATTGSLAGALSGKTQLFVIGIGPAAK